MQNDLITKSSKSFLPRVLSPKKSLQTKFDDLLDNFFGDSFSGLPVSYSNLINTLEPRVNIYEDEKSYYIEAEVAGIKKEDVKVECHSNNLVIKAEKEEEKTEKNKNYHRVESSYGSMMRSFDLPFDADQEKIDAQIKDGVLKIVLPKATENNSKTKEIKVK